MPRSHPTKDDALIALASQFEEPYCRWHEGNAARRDTLADLVAWEVEETRLFEALRPVVDAILSHKATTRAGLALQAHAITMSVKWDGIADEDDPGARNIQGFIASVSAYALGSSPVAAPDPIFAAIERHRAAWTRYEAQALPTSDCLESVLDAAARALAEPTFTTLAGAKAFLRYATSEIGENFDVDLAAFGASFLALETQA
jgi:hypothetical protein